MSATSQPDKLSVFISYSRDDLTIADQLEATLQIGGFDTVLDRHGIQGGEDWQEKLGHLIRDADTVVFLLSRSSAQSTICAWEVDEALRLGKRILPILVQPLASAAPPPKLAALNFIHLYAEPRKPGSGFGPGLRELVAALRTDRAWLQEQTRLLQRASEWITGGRSANRLLSGADIEAAKSWLARRPKEAPPPSEVHLEFIKASEGWAERQQSAERQRLKEMAEAIEARAEAQRQAETALFEREAERKRRSRLQMSLMTGALLAAIGFGVFGLYSWRLNEKLSDVVAKRDTAIDELEAANLRLNREIGLRIAPYGNEMQSAKSGWYRIATDFTGAVAVVRSREKRPVGTGFIVRGGALYEPWGDETFFVTTSFNVGHHRNIGAVEANEVVAQFPGRDGRTTEVGFSDIVWQSIDTPPSGLGISILRLSGKVPFGAKRIESVGATSLDDLPALDISGRTAIDKPAQRLLATIGNPVGQGGDLQFNLIVSHLLGIEAESKKSGQTDLVYTYATGPGASGSPIFDISTGELLGVHQAGSPVDSKTRVGRGAAVQAVMAAIKADPDWRRDRETAEVNRAQRLIDQGKRIDIESLIADNAARKPREAARIALAYAKRLASMGEIDDAERVFTQATTLDPDATRTISEARTAALIDWGETALAGGDEAAAEAIFKRALSTRDDTETRDKVGHLWSQHFLGKAETALETQDLDSARKHFELAAMRATAPDDRASALARSAESWLAKNWPAEALPAIEKARMIEPDELRHRLLLGLIRLALGLTGDACEDRSRFHQHEAFSLIADSAPFDYFTARCDEHQGRKDVAVSAYQRTIDASDSLVLTSLTAYLAEQARQRLTALGASSQAADKN